MIFEEEPIKLVLLLIYINMSCKKYTLVNTGSTSVNISYQKCDDNLSQKQILIRPNQRRNIWAYEGTFSFVGSSTPSITSRIFPVTPSNTRTPTPSVTPTKNFITPTTTSSNTPTPSSSNIIEISSTPTPTPTNTLTPTNTETPTPTNTLTPTNTETPTPTNTPTNTETPTTTPTNTETPTTTPTNTPSPTIPIVLIITEDGQFIMTENDLYLITEESEYIPITPSNTKTPTPTNTVTPTITPTNTVTPTITPSVTPTIPLNTLILTFSDLNFPVANPPSDVNNWNTFFDLPNNGIPFNEVIIDNDNYKVFLKGGSNIHLKNNLFLGISNIISFFDITSITSIGNNVFVNTTLVSFYSSTVAELGSTSFYECITLTDVDLPNLLIAGDYAFWGCSNITNLNLPLMNSIGGATFREIGTSSNLSGVTFPYLTGTTNSIETYCFGNCTTIKNFYLPSIQRLTSSFFENCTSAEYFNLSACTEFGDYPFTDSQNFAGITGQTISLIIPHYAMVSNGGNPDLDIQYLLDNNNVTVTEVSPPSLILGFDDVGNSNLLVTNPENVDDWNSFFDLPTFGTPFENVFVDNVNNTIELYGGGNIKIKPDLMNDHFENTFLISVNDLNGCISSVGGNAFSYCYGLTGVTLPSCTIIYDREETVVGQGAFESCLNLTELSVPLLISAGTYCFTYCGSIKTFNSNNLTYLGIGAFSYCTGLTDVSLTNLLTLETYTFDSCTSLTGLTIPNLTTAQGDSLVNTGLVSIYLPELINVGEYAIANNFYLQEINFPKLTTTARNTFRDCISLTTINLPELVNVGELSFYGCSSLTNISLPKVTNTLDASFGQCYSLINLNLPMCDSLGTTVLYNDVFQLISGNTINFTATTQVMTCNSGAPDGDIQYLQANNTVNITTV